MNITIKLDKRKKGLTAHGYPIVVRVDGKIQRTGYYSKVNHWVNGTSAPNAKHPDYYFLLDYLDSLKLKINQVLLADAKNGLTRDQAVRMLFSKTSEIFIELITIHLGPYDGSSKWSAVKAFDVMYPRVGVSRIDRQMVDNFVKKRLRAGNRPSGVDSYVRSLRSLWNELPDLSKDNPFSSHKIELPGKINPVPTDNDLIILRDAELSYNGVNGSYGMYRDYFLLMFYLGGIDLEVLSRLKYPEHVFSGRLRFRRDKGNSKASCNVMIPEAALDLLAKYKEDGSEYLVPIHKAPNYKNFRDKFRRRFGTVCRRLELSVVLGTKGARFTFIDRAQQLLVDERLTAQIVGHRRRTVTSLYTNDFPEAVQDAAHMKIISF